MTAWDRFMDFLDLMMHPGRRIKERDEKDVMLERRYQTATIHEARLKTDAMFVNALANRHDWSRQ